MDAQELQDLEKVSTTWIKNLNKIVNKMNNTVSSMIGMNPKNVIKLDTVPLDKKYPEETILTKDRFIDIFISLANNMETKKDKQQTLSGVKIRIN